MNTPGGKGSTQRPTDHEAFSSAWDRIFGKKPECENKENCHEPFCQCEVKDERSSATE